MNNHKYKIKYDFKPEVGQFMVDELDGHGATDAFVFCSMIYPEDGSFSHNHFSIDGRTGKSIKDIEMFKNIMMLSMSLLQEGRENPLEDGSWQKEILKMFVEDCKAMITMGHAE